MVYVVADEADHASITEAITTMPDYFAPYRTTVNFITEEEFERDHQGMPHGGHVITSGDLGGSRSSVEFALELGSNPDFTAASQVAYHLQQIEGYEALHATPPTAQTFTGLSVPDPYTLVAKLNAGDCEFDKQLVHPVASPVPSNAGDAKNATFNDAPVGEILGSRAEGVHAQFKGPDDSVIQEQVFGAAVKEIDAGESPIVIRAYLDKLTRSELFLMMVVGLATVAGSLTTSGARPLTTAPAGLLNRSGAGSVEGPGAGPVPRVRASHSPRPRARAG